MKADGKPLRVVLDASALIGLITWEDGFEVLKSLLRALDDGDAQLVESTAIFAEVLPEHPNSPNPKARQNILARLQSADVELIDVNLVVARKAAELRVKYGLKTWDAVHLATAVVAQADVFIARDHKFPDGTIVEGVLVREPYDVFEGMLPFQ